MEMFFSPSFIAPQQTNTWSKLTTETQDQCGESLLSYQERYQNSKLHFRHF